MIFFRCLAHGAESKLEIHEDKIALFVENTNALSNKPVNNSISLCYTSIKSLHVKNNENFMLKIKTEDDSFIIEFSSMHVRDLVKSMILSSISIAEGINKSIISANNEYKNIFRNLKGIISNSSLFSLVNRHEQLFFQKNNQAMVSNYPAELNQTLVDIFVEMNCSIEQFFNLLINSYFYDIKNTKNSVDRLLSDKIRKFSIGMDYATRINTASLLGLAEQKEVSTEARNTRSKAVEFAPVYVYSNVKENKETVNTKQINLGTISSFLDDNLSSFNNNLTVDLKVTDQKEIPYFEFNSSDFESARDLCKIVFKNSLKKNESGQLADEAMKFSDDFLNIIEGKYGKEALNYIRKLVPRFYMK